MKGEISTWVRWGAGLALLTIALAAGTLGLALNVTHGLEAGLAAGIAFGLADGAKVLIPVVAGLVGWDRQMKLTAAVCVAVSLWSAVNVYMDGAGQALLAREHGAESYAEKQKAIGELEAEAARLDALASAESKKGGCGPNCRDLMRQASEARQQLHEARERREHAKPVEISGMAAMIASASGSGQEGIARGIGAIKALLFLILVEALVWLSVPAMRLMARKSIATASEPIATPAATDEGCKSVAISSEPTVAAEVAAVTKGSKAYYLQRLERDHPQLASAVAIGKLSVYAASIQAGLRKPPAAKSTKWTKIDAYLETTPTK